MGRRFTESEILAMTRNRREDKALKEKLERLAEERGYYHDNVVREKKKIVQVIKESRKTSGENPFPESEDRHDEPGTVTLQQMRRFTKPWSITTSQSTFNVLYQRTSSPTDFKNKNRRPKSSIFSSASSMVSESITHCKNVFARSRTAYSRNALSRPVTRRESCDANGKSNDFNAETAEGHMSKESSNNGFQDSKLLNGNTKMHIINGDINNICNKENETDRGKCQILQSTTDDVFAIDSDLNQTSFLQNTEELTREAVLVPKSETMCIVTNDNCDSRKQNVKCATARKNKKKRVSLVTNDQIQNQCLDENENVVNNERKASTAISKIVDGNRNLESNEDSLLIDDNYKTDKKDDVSGRKLSQVYKSDDLKQNAPDMAEANETDDDTVGNNSQRRFKNASTNQSPNGQQQSEKRTRPHTCTGEIQRDLTANQKASEDLIMSETEDRTRPHTVTGVENMTSELNEDIDEDIIFGDYIWFKGHKIRDYVKPQHRYKNDPFKMKRREKLMKKLATETPLFAEDQREKILNVELTFSKASRKRMLQQLVEENSAKQHSTNFDSQSKKLDSKIQTFLKSIETFCRDSE